MNLFHFYFFLSSLTIACNGGCHTAPLIAFIKNVAIAKTISVAGEFRLPLEGTDSSITTAGAHVLMQCNYGYVLSAGELNITCLGDEWTPFPICIRKSRDIFTGSKTDSTNKTDGFCDIDGMTFMITNGHHVQHTLSYNTDKKATGSIRFGCKSGYVIDATIGEFYICNNGVWSTKPQCLKTARCPFSILKQFFKYATGIQTTNSSRLLQATDENNAVIQDSFILFKCKDGYKNIGGNLNVTCLLSGSWSLFPNCTSETSNESITTIDGASNNDISCIIDEATFTIANGYYSNNSLSYTTSNKQGTGSIEFACNRGYVLDESIGRMYICNHGIWSTKPKCLKTGRCIFSALQRFLNNATGIRSTGQSSLIQATAENDVVIQDSFILLKCNDGYRNVDGNLNVTCMSNSSWSSFPSCISNVESEAISPMNSITTTSNEPCLLDQNIFTIANGHYLYSSLTYKTNDRAIGWIQFECDPGYELDTAIGAIYSCNNSIWSTKPRCLMTTRCSYRILQSSIANSTGLQQTNQTLLLQVSGESDTVLGNSYILFMCMDGFKNVAGNLNVTCTSNGTWSPFPQCVSMQNISCAVDSTTLVIENGQYLKVNLSYKSNSEATGSIQFECQTGYELDSTIGATYSCKEGVWSTKPRCLKRVRCSFSALAQFANGAHGMQTTGPSNLLQVRGEANEILPGSYVLFTCIHGYRNIGGNFNVTCNNDGTWSSFPSCVSNFVVEPMAAITRTLNDEVPCEIGNTTLNITNGYISQYTLVYRSDNKAAGSVQFECYSGYGLDVTIGGLYICMNGTWSPKPKCIKIGQCSLSVLAKLLFTKNALQTTGQNRLASVEGDNDMVASGSYILLACTEGYRNIGGNLNITCNANGSWSDLPNCI